jgi:outer membrane protein assembly factor BamB
MQGFDVPRTGYNPYETTLGTGNAGGLHVAWTLPLSSYTICSPVLASDVLVNGVPADLLYTGSEHGDFYAVNAATGQVVWQRNLGSVHVSCTQIPDGVYGVSGSPVIDRAANRVYAAGGDGRVYAMDLATGAIATGWPVAVTADPPHEHVWSALALRNGVLYACIASYCDIVPYHGRIVGIDVASARRVSYFFPSGRVNGGGIWAYGGVSIDSTQGDVYTATGNALFIPESFRYSDNVVRLTPSLDVVASNYPGLIGADLDFGSTPVLYQPSGCSPLLAVENKDGELLLYDRNNISSGPIQRIQMAANLGSLFIGDVAYSPVTNTVYVSNSSDSNNGTYRHGLVALRMQNCRLQLAWQNTLGVNRTTPPPPTVANGVVYWGSGDGNHLYAFDASSGQQLWDSGATIGGAIFEAPVVVNGRVYVGAWDKKLYAFVP